MLKRRFFTLFTSCLAFVFVLPLVALQFIEWANLNLFLVPRNPKAKSQDGSKPNLALLKETER